jgi:hypothetical protein
MNNTNSNFRNMENRRNKKWILCNNHKNCNSCKYALKCWKEKAQYHSAKSQSLKFVLDSILNDRTDMINNNDDLSNTINEWYDNASLVSKETNLTCGICVNKYTYGGVRNMCCLGCSHTICLECLSKMDTNNFKCPYCRKDINKIYKLHYEE